jgi:hypothetical protein
VQFPYLRGPLGPDWNPRRLPVVVDELDEDAALAASSLLEVDLAEVFEALEASVDRLSVPAEPDGEASHWDADETETAARSAGEQFT